MKNDALDPYAKIIAEVLLCKVPGVLLMCVDYLSSIVNVLNILYHPAYNQSIDIFIRDMNKILSYTSSLLCRCC